MLLKFALAYLFFSTSAIAQVVGDQVDDLRITSLSPARVRLSWKAVDPIACVTAVSYTIYHSTKDGFEAADSNRVLSGVKSTAITLTDRDADSFYRVFAVETPVSCPSAPTPGYHGLITIHPLEGDKGSLIAILRTKWRPEAKLHGGFSYLIEASYLGPGDSTEYYRKSRLCGFSLEITDVQGFKIREIPITFVATVAGEGKATGLEANDVTNLTTLQYRDFAKGGSWNLAWACPAT